MFTPEPRGRVFVTYDTGVTGDDWDRILKDVVHIRTNVKNNQFSVTMDTASNNSEPVRKAIRKNFEEVGNSGVARGGVGESGGAEAFWKK